MKTEKCTNHQNHHQKNKTMRTITLKRAQEIASLWHGSQWSALYQFASSGVYMSENHLRYLKELQEDREPEYNLRPGTISKKDDAELKMLQRYFIAKGEEKGIFTEWHKHTLYGYLIPSVTGKCKNVLPLYIPL